MIAVPALTPETTPGVAGTMATSSSDELHVPATVLLSVMDEPAHTDVSPVGAAGTACTDTDLVAIQPFTDV